MVSPQLAQDVDATRLLSEPTNGTPASEPAAPIRGRTRGRGPASPAPLNPPLGACFPCELKRCSAIGCVNPPHSGQRATRPSCRSCTAILPPQWIQQNLIIAFPRNLPAAPRYPPQAHPGKSSVFDRYAGIWDPRFG